MANDRSFMNNELQKSSSFLDYCIPPYDSDPNNIKNIKLDNFNLRLRCYHMNELLNICTCSHIKNNTNINKEQENINKLNSFIDNQKDLQAEKSLLQEENKILKSKLNYLKNTETKLAEFESVKYECEQLKNVLNNNLSENEFLQVLMKQNEELIKSNIEAKLKIKCLKLNLNNTKRRTLMEESQFLLNLSYSRNLQTTLNQNFNDSLEISKNVSQGCPNCDALKVNYDHIYQIFMKEVDMREMTLKASQCKELRIKDLEKELESLKSQPIVSEEKVKKYKQLIKDSLKSIVKRDEEIVQIKNESKEMVNFYATEMGKLNHRVESLLQKGKCNLTYQNITVQNLSSMLSDIFDHLSINTKPEGLEKSDSFSNRSLQFIDSDLNLIKRSWDTILSSINKIQEHVVCKEQHLDNVECNNSKEIRDKRNKSVENDQSHDLSLERILYKFDEVKELSEGLKVVSKSFNSSYHDLHASCRKELNENENFSPQYILGRAAKNKLQEDKSITDPFASICYEKDHLDNTAYQSFTMENLYSDLFNSSAFDVMLQKIEELGEVIHRYSEIVRDIKINEEESKIDKSCLANFDKEENEIDEYDSFFDGQKLKDSSRSKDLSILKTLYRDEKEKFESEIQEKQQIIEDLNDKERLYKTEIDELQFQLDKYEMQIEELSKTILSCKNSYEETITSLNSKISNTEEQLIQQKSEYDIKMDELQTDISEHISKAIFLETELKDLKCQLLDDKSLISNLEIEKDNLSQEIMQLSKNYENIQTAFSECQINKELIEDEIKESKCQLSKLNSIIIDLESEKENLAKEIIQLSQQFENSKSELLDCKVQNNDLENNLKESQLKLLNYQMTIDNLETEKAHITKENIMLTQDYENSRSELLDCVKQKEIIEVELKELECKLRDLQAAIEILESEKKLLYPKNQTLKDSDYRSISDCELNTVRYNLETSNEQSTETDTDQSALAEEDTYLEMSKLKDELCNAIKSLENMTKSWQMVSKFSDFLSSIIKDIYHKMISMQIIKCDHQILLDDPIDMMNLIGNHILEIKLSDEKHIIPKTSEMKELVDKLVSSENDYYSSGILKHKDLQIFIAPSSMNTSETQSISSSFNDLTNITSICTDSELEHGQTTPKLIDFSGFKIKSHKDVVNHPELVVQMLREYKKDIESLKRRLSMRYDENKHLKQMISRVYAGNMYDSLSMKMEKLKEECSSNNENVEKVVKRNSKS